MSLVMLGEEKYRKRCYQPWTRRGTVLTGWKSREEFIEVLDGRNESGKMKVRTFKATAKAAMVYLQPIIKTIGNCIKI